MTFRESEFPSLMTQLETILDKYPPAAVTWFVREMARIYRAIPVYPGLVGVCLWKAFEPCAADKPAPAKGSRVVVWPTRGRALAGQLSAWTTGAISVDVEESSGRTSRVKLSRSRIRLVERFRADTLEAFWPTLVFDKKTGTVKRRTS